MLLFQTFGNITIQHALTFSSDMKLGHYMKVPPRPMFWAQVVAMAVSGTVQLGIQAWMFENIPGICEPNQPSGFICPTTQVFGTGSIIWGVIGPKLQYSKGQIYYHLSWAWIAGAIAPIVPYFCAKRWPKSWWKYVNMPVIIADSGAPPATALNYVPWMFVGFIFQYLIRKRYSSWWTKYNYVLSAALDSGAALAIIVIFFCLQYPRNGHIGHSDVPAASEWGILWSQDMVVAVNKELSANKTTKFPFQELAALLHQDLHGVVQVLSLEEEES
ncbi:hypothetical protein FRB99_003635 [Tulasnella sp. 403]|nr:hypothetical protein FRB99_003635 [Tulasnella sp. 403]